MLVTELALIVLGLMVGSFLNVCITRVPRGESIVFPNSHCPRCGNPIKPYDNIPVVSYLLLRGKCRSCSQKISWQYPVVETLTALTFWLSYRFLGLDIRTIILLILFSAIWVLVFIDLNHRILPNVITLSGVALGLVSSLLAPVRDGSAELLLGLFDWVPSSPMLISFLDSLLGALICGGFLWAVAELYLRIRKIEGLGFGDIKLMGMVGAFLGVKLTLLTIMLGSMMGAVIGIIFIKLTGKDSRYELPFGSFLGLATIISAALGSPDHWGLHPFGSRPVRENRMGLTRGSDIRCHGAFPIANVERSSHQRWSKFRHCCSTARWLTERSPGRPDECTAKIQTAVEGRCCCLKCSRCPTGLLFDRPRTYRL